MQGQLFTLDFLTRGILDTDPWRTCDDAALDGFTAALRRVYGSLAADSTLNERQTEDELIGPILDLLGWGDSWMSQVNLSESGRDDVLDFLLFPDAGAKARALKERSDDRRTHHGIALLEAKRWMRPLDRTGASVAGATKPRDFGAPSSQMLRYLSRAEVMSDRAIKWGLLTNGAMWRLYWQDARSRAEEFFELEVASLLEIPGTHLALDELDSRRGLKLFRLLFHREAFLPQSWDGERRSYHAIALTEARRYEETVSHKLGERVFAEVFPDLANALAASDLHANKDGDGCYTRAYLDELREAALVLLYRLLFVLYAEDRALLPVRDARYQDYSLTALRDEIADKRDHGRGFSGTASNYWWRLDNLISIIADGDDAVGMPAYNGGLFERSRAPILARVRVADAKLAPVIDALSRRTEDILKPRINYRDLSVSHLGGIYERLLEFTFVQEKAGATIVAQPASFARKVSGSYYTHDDLVRLILDESVGRLVAERANAFEALIKRYGKKSALKPYEWDALAEADTAAQLLELKICDPAMGSGHFLVALVDYLADRVLVAMQEADDKANAAPWAAHLVEQGRPYASPVVARLADIRRRILATGHDHKWALDERQLDDRHIVRRMILKKVIFGVDKNPMAVELAKVALWLHTFTVGAPLSFLDHHLKCGDSLHGEKLETVRAGMSALGTLLQAAELARLEVAARSLEAVAELTDTSIAEAHESKRLADEAEAQVAPIHALLDFWRTLRWLVPGWPIQKKKKIRDKSPLSAAELAVAEIFSGRYNLSGIVIEERIEGEGPDVRAANDLLARAVALAKRERFFHWWTAFPTVWPASGGFDAVIGNPPWDRIKLQEVEWFAERELNIARQARAADRKRMIDDLRKKSAPLWHEYLEASERAESHARVLRDSGDYPLLGGGDVNLYSLFVERGTALAQTQGLVGLLTPSGIAADKGAAEFFRGISSTGRLAALLDFENRCNPGGSYFPDVDSRFKFCALAFGGEGRRFETAKCAFFLHTLTELEDSNRVLALTSSDFTRVNPNTGAAPIFRTKRDAELTTHMYANHPVLVNRSMGTEKKVWPVRYVTMFHMTNDSDKFLTRAELEKRGWKPAPLNRWAKGKAEAVPLYEGKMVQMYDHRAADVVVNAANLHRAAQQEAISEAQKLSADRLAQSQFYVLEDLVRPVSALGWALGFKEITAPTNMRTMIAALMPGVAFGNKVPVLIPEDQSPENAAVNAALLLSNMNTFAFDFSLRQKLQGQTINLFILEQSPVIAPAVFEQRVGKTKIADYIRAEVLALTYTAHDMAPLARDLGYVDGSGRVKPPFVWDPEERRHRMARLDALFMHLYGLGEADADYILSAFPIVREKDEAAFGTYRTRDLILAYLQRIEKGLLSHAGM